MELTPCGVGCAGVWQERMEEDNQELTETNQQLEAERDDFETEGEAGLARGPREGVGAAMEASSGHSAGPRGCAPAPPRRQRSGNLARFLPRLATATAARPPLR